MVKGLRVFLTTKQYNSAINTFLLWRLKFVPDKIFVLLLCTLVGILSGISAALIKNAVYLVEALLTGNLAEDQESLLFFFLPGIGITLTVLIIRFGIKQEVGPGIPSTLYAISKGNALMPKKRRWSSIITAAFTVGFGGSSGLEAPTVATAAAVASNLGKKVRVNYKTRKLLIGCAAAGALAGIFKAPIAAIVFAIEVIMLDLTTASLIPLLLASTSATLTSRWIFGTDVLFHFSIKDPFVLSDIPYFVALGAVCGILSVYFTKVHFWVVSLFDKTNYWILRVAVGGLALGALIFLLPPLYGEGYGTINHILLGDFQKTVANSLFHDYKDNVFIVLGFLSLVVIFKAFAATITTASGGVGGIFAPTLFMGSIVGFIFSKLVNTLSLGKLSESNFSLVGMASLMAGIMQAPLTAIFLIAEITGGYELFIPLMIVTSISFITVKYFVPYSVYTMQLASRGALITHDKDQAVLTLMRLEKEIERDFVTVNPYDDLGALVKAIAKSKRNIFPVIDENNYYLGSVQLNDVRLLMFEKEKYHSTFVHELMSAPAEKISIEDKMEEVMNKFESSGAWNLPVLKEGVYVGFVSKSKLFSAYRNLLKDFYEE